MESTTIGYGGLFADTCGSKHIPGFLEASRKYPFDLNECINFCLQEQWSAIFTGMSITSISLPCIGGDKCWHSLPLQPKIPFGFDDPVVELGRLHPSVMIDPNSIRKSLTVSFCELHIPCVVTMTLSASQSTEISLTLLLCVLVIEFECM